MYNDFIVKVFRYREEENGSRGWDGWYFSKVYAIDGNEFLVYDNGDCSAYNGEEEFCETGFNWVDFTATMDRCGESGRQPMVEPLVPFDIVEFMADRKTENSSEKPNNCETCKWGEWYRQGYDITMMDDECGGCCSWNSKWTPKDEPQYDFGEYADRLWKIAYERGKREALEQTEPSCDTCKLKDTTEWCKRQEVCRAYQPKDEPQTERSE